MRTIITIFILILIAAVAPHAPRANPSAAQSVFASAYNTSTNGLISWWKLESDTDSVAVDQMGNNDGTWTNGASSTDAAGFVGNGGSFDGDNDYVDVGTMGNFGSDMDDGFSVSLWYKTTDGRDLRSLMGTLDDGATSLFGLHLNWWYDGNSHFDDGSIILRLRDDDNTNYDLYLTGDSNRIDGNWHHLVVTSNPSTNSGNIYFDGEDANAQNGREETPDNMDNFTYSLAIGARNVRGNLDQHFNGSIDEVRIYNRALPAHEIRRLYLQGHSQSDEVNE